jgi:zinc resistance-associated protein
MLAACCIGYVIGAWHVTALRSAGSSSAAEAVALRFPQEWSAAPPAITLAALKSLSADAGLFSPVPMVLPSQPQSIAEQPALEKTSAPSDPHMVQTASLDSVGLPVAAAAEGLARPAPRAVAKPSAAPARPLAASRPGYILDDAQIASIKERLHLTPDQESMWPAVEAALRNMAYKRAQQAAARGAARNVQAAAVDPEAVQGLKSAAVPLIMSFNDEQKEEVRSLAHVMGLDQLAAQF